MKTNNDVIAIKAMKIQKRKSAQIVVPVERQSQINETDLFSRVAEIIETRKFRAAVRANCEVTMMYWEIGKYIGSVLLGNEHAEYGKKIFSTLSKKLVEQYGNVFDSRNLRRMIQFPELFPDIQIVSPLATQLSWRHFK